MRIERGLDSQNCQQAIHHQHFQYAVPVSCVTLPGDITLYKQATSTTLTPAPRITQGYNMTTSIQTTCGEKKKSL